MKGSRCRGRSILLSVLLAVAAAAHPPINMTGRLVLTGAEGGAFDFVQNGTSLTDGTRFGTIDSTTGAFVLSDGRVCLPLISCGDPQICGGGCRLFGTVAP